MAASFLPFSTDLVTALGWAILHSLWQALLVFTCLRIVLRLWPDAAASVKYNLSFMSLAGIFGWFVVTLYQQLAAVKEAQTVAMLPAMEVTPPLPSQAPVLYQSQQELTWLFPDINLAFTILVGLYIAGVAVMCIKLIADLAQLQQIKKRQVLQVDAAWEHYLDKLKRQLRIPRKVRLLISQYIQVPVMIGFLKPVILVPAAMFNNLSAEQLEAILLHELAHIKRNDYILNIFQSIVETTLFFNPFVWWISKYIRREREHCCDDMVIAHSIQPLHYAKALVALEEYRFTTNSMAMAAADDKQHLFYRIKRIMEMKTTHLNYSQKLMAVLIIAVGLTAIAWITPSAKEDEKNQTADASAAVMQLPADTVPQKVNKGNPTNSSDRKENPSAGDSANPESDESQEQQEMKAARDKMEDAQDQMRAVQEQMRAVHEQMRVSNDATQKAVQEAMKNIDWQAINAQTKEALKAVDWKKINKEIETSLKAIDWDKINAEVNAAVKESKESVDPELIRQSVELGLKSAQTAMASIDIERIIKESMAHAHRGISEAERANIRKEMNKARAAQREAMREAREESRTKEREARREVIRDRQAENAERVKEAREHASHQQYKELISKLTDDKLIDPSKSFSIEKKNDELYINGAKQPAAVMNKYRSYLRSAQISIKGDKDNLQVDIQDRDDDDNNN